jgi:hypothetical protein
VGPLLESARPMKPMSSSAQIQVSLPQHRYYRGVILPAIREYSGYESDALAHRALKAGFYDRHPDDPTLPSMADMSQDEGSRFMEYCLRQAAEMGLALMDPEPKTRDSLIMRDVKIQIPMPEGAAMPKTEIQRETGGDDCAFAIGPVGR